MSFTTQECMMMHLLNCGSSDLSLLEDINYDLDETIDYLVENNDLSFNSLLREVFRMGVQELDEYVQSNRLGIRGQIEDNLKWHQDVLDEGRWMDEDDWHYHNEEKDECEADLEILDKLAPLKQYETYINYQDTSICIEYLPFYQKYFEYKIDDIEDKMGWCFGNKTW